MDAQIEVYAQVYVYCLTKCCTQTKAQERIASEIYAPHPMETIFVKSLWGESRSNTTSEKQQEGLKQVHNQFS